MSKRPVHDADCDALFGDTCSCRDARRDRKTQRPKTGKRAKLVGWAEGNVSIGDGCFYRRPLYPGGQ